MAKKFRDLVARTMTADSLSALSARTKELLAASPLPAEPTLERLMDAIIEASRGWAFAASEGSSDGIVVQTVERVAAAKAALREYVSEDTRRLDWLESNPGLLEPANAVSPGWNMEGFHDEEEGWGSEELNLWCPTLRAAIDKARLSHSDHPPVSGEPV